MPARLFGLLGVSISAVDEIRSRSGDAVSRPVLSAGDHESIGKHLACDQFGVRHRGGNVGDFLAVTLAARAAVSRIFSPARQRRREIAVTTFGRGICYYAGP